MPWLHPERRLNSGGALTAYEDDLLDIYSAGVRAVVSTLNIPSDAGVYEAAGFAFMCLPVPNGEPPTMEQAKEFLGFVEAQLAKKSAVAVHCEEGLGRTGTMVGVYLISHGETARSAIGRIRAVEKDAVETVQQIRFLELFEQKCKQVRMNFPPPAASASW